MSLIKKYPLKYDVTKLCSELDTLFPLEVYKWHDEFPCRNGTWYHNLYEGDLPQHIIDAVNNSIGVKIKPFQFLWNWNCTTTELEMHRDNYEAATDAHTLGQREEYISDFDQVVFVEDAKKSGRKEKSAPLNVVVGLQNYTKIEILNDKTNKWETMTYGPGEVVFFNNEYYFHKVFVVGNDKDTIPKWSLNCYVDHSEVTNPNFWN